MQDAAAAIPVNALRVANYRVYAAGFLASSMSLQALNTAVMWDLYERTRDPMALGYTGLARALPVLLLALPAGHAADVFSRRRILVMTQLAFALIAAALAVSAWRGVPVWTVYVLLVCMGCARAFNGPSRNALLPLIVPIGTLQSAVTWNSNIFQAAAVGGPLLAGVIIDAAGGAWPVFALAACGMGLFALAASIVKPSPQPRNDAGMSVAGLFAGASHLLQERTILGALALDLFAVLLGGATALLPIYAKDVLTVPAGLEGIALGALKAAPYLGALIVGLWLAHRPLFKRAGPTLLWSVAAFGVATIIFGLSRSFWVAMAALVVAGGVDNVSVVIRHVLVQLRTPDHLRGRVGAVNAMFIESSNELGAFESGLVARLVSPVFSVVSGGIGTIVVVGAVATWIPELRRLREVEERK